MLSRWVPIVLVCGFALGCRDDAGGGDDELGSESGTSSTSESDSGSDSGSESDTASTSESDSGSESTSDTGGPLDDLLTLDHVQLEGTHNSYHVEPQLPFDPSHEYTHPPLDVQLEDYGVRSFELDLHRNGDLLLVYHIQVIDALTTCTKLSDCLTTIKGWSDAHSSHVPIMVWLEIKDSTGGMTIDDLGLVDQTILDVFPAERVLTPDLVRGSHATLREAIETEGWPKLGQVRGTIMFMVLNGDHPSVAAYTQGNTNLDGRMMFVDVEDFTLPYAAVSKIDDPSSPAIADAHAAGVLTASNICGAGTAEDECFTKLAAGLASGSHDLMDDFLAPIEGGTYFLDLPGGNPARCNEVTAPPECTAAAIEDLP